MCAPTLAGERNGYRINEGLHSRCPIVWVREEDNCPPPIPISSHRRSGKKSQTAARVVGQRKPGKLLGWRLKPWRLFDQIFFAKKFDSIRYSGRCVCTDGSRGNGERRTFAGGGTPPLQILNNLSATTALLVLHKKHGWRDLHPCICLYSILAYIVIYRDHAKAVFVSFRQP